MAIDTLLDFIFDNILLLSILIIILIILIIIIKKSMGVKSRKWEMQKLELEIEKRKLDMMEKRLYIDSLQEAATVLTDKERKKLDSIKVDTSVLSRRTLSLMSEVEERMKRLERAADIGRLSKTLGKIGKYEDEIFGNDYEIQKKIKGGGKK